MIEIDPYTSRHGPSIKYVSYLKEYEEFHLMGKRMFNGRSLLKFVEIIQEYLKRNKCKTLLDYGSGKGQLYTEDFSEITDEIDRPLPEYWNLDEYQLFDPAYEEHAKLPVHKKDAVICTDVLEHIPETDLGWVVDEIFSYARKMVFLNVACFEAMKTFKDGTNVHVSVFSPDDWLQFLAHRSRQFPKLVIYVFADTIDAKTDEFLTRGFRIDQYPRIIELKDKERTACLELPNQSSE